MFRSRGKTVKWEGIEGEVTLDIETLSDRSKAAVALMRTADEDDRRFDAVEVNFESSGYRDPGRYDGPREHCYPAESDDERIVTDVFFVPGNAKPKVRLNDEIIHVLAHDPLVETAVEQAELEFPEPDYDAMYEAARERAYGW